MGMYDYINGEQVKCFYSPIYQEGDDSETIGTVWHSGGNLRGFNDGDNVPLSTLYYKYPSNFAIFDYNVDYSDAIIHFIKDGKVFKTVASISDSLDEDIESMELIVNYFGHHLNIKSKTDMYEYLKEKAQFEATRKELKRDSNEIYKELQQVFKNMRRIEASNSNDAIFKLLENEDVQTISGEIVKELNLNSQDLNIERIRDLKLDILENSKLLTMIKNIVKCRLQAKFDKIADIHDEKIKIYESNMEPIHEEFSQKWDLKRDSDVEHLGELLDCLIFYLKTKEDIDLYGDRSKTLENCRYTIRTYLANNKNIQEKYLNWVDVNKAGRILLEDYIKSQV